MTVPEIDDVRCRLLVRVPAALSPELVATLHDLAAADRLAGLVAGGDAAPVALAASLPTALLLDGAFEPEPGADGVVAALGDDAEMEVTALRRAWGTGGLIVAAVGTSRHRAMEAGEFGADAVAFDGPVEAVADCLLWWQGLFVLPAAARATAATLERLVAAGADFLIVDGDDLAAGTSTRIEAAERQRAAPSLSGDGSGHGPESNDEDQR